MIIWYFNMCHMYIINIGTLIIPCSGTKGGQKKRPLPLPYHMDIDSTLKIILWLYI